MVTKIKKHSETIIISLAVGILTFYIQPILATIGDSLVSLFIYVNSSFSDVYYKAVAKDDPYVFEQFSSYILTNILVGTVVIMALKLSITRKELQKRISTQLEKIQSLREKIADASQEPVVTKEKTLEELNELEVQVQDRQTLLAKRNSSFIIMIVLSLSLSILLYSSYIFNKSIANENIEFRNRMIVLRPYVGSKAIDSLYSRWYSIKNSEDYINILTEIKHLEEKYLNNPSASVGL